MPAAETAASRLLPEPRVLRGCALGAWAALVALIATRYLLLEPPPGVSRWLPLALLLMPLMVPVRGLYRGSAYTFAWTGFVALFYFAFAVDSLFAIGASRALGVAELIASVTLFGACVLYPRASAHREAMRRE